MQVTYKEPSANVSAFAQKLLARSAGLGILPYT